MRTRTLVPLALSLLAALACAVPSAPRDPAEAIASQSFDEISLRYDGIQAEVRQARTDGRMSADMWGREWTPLQFAVSTAAARTAGDLATWRTGGSRPITYDQNRAALDTAVTNAELYAKGLRR